MFGMVLLPIAYVTFFLMMNSKGLLGEHRPRGRKRVIWNTLMILSASTATFASLATLQKNLGVLGLQIFAGFLALAVAVHVLRGRR